MREAAQILRQMSDIQFPGFSDQQWEKQARGTWRESEGRMVLNYDPALMKTLDALDLEMPMPDLWPLFEGMSSWPVLAIRAGNSDLLTAETLRNMQQRHPRITALTVPDQGHAPVLDGDLIRAIEQLIANAENPN
jgi:pimeloyl-ACP methyl ester carboxylesterase